MNFSVSQELMHGPAQRPAGTIEGSHIYARWRVNNNGTWNLFIFASGSEAAFWSIWGRPGRGAFQEGFCVEFPGTFEIEKQFTPFRWQFQMKAMAALWPYQRDGDLIFRIPRRHACVNMFVGIKCACPFSFGCPCCIATSQFYYHRRLEYLLEYIWGRDEAWIK